MFEIKHVIKILFLISFIMNKAQLTLSVYYRFSYYVHLLDTCVYVCVSVYVLLLHKKLPITRSVCVLFHHVIYANI